MKMVPTVLLGLTLTGLAQAQESIPAERAQEVARVLAKAAKAIGDGPFHSDADPAKVTGIRAKERGLMVIPERGLSGEVFDDGSKGIIPIGQLWLRDMSPVIDGKTIGPDDLRLVKIAMKDGEEQLALLLLAASRDAAGQWDLLVYSKGKEPLTRLPLKKSAASARDLPIELVARQNDNQTGDLTLNLLGKYEGVLVLAPAD